MTDASIYYNAGMVSSKALLIASVVSLLMLTLAPITGTAQEWSGTLKGGGTVTVDPRTNRATITRDGVQSQLWDGVHQLQDGTSLTTRSGIAVPTTPMLESREPVPEDLRLREWIGAPIAGYSPCERLVRNVCGSSDECATASGCGPAKQLLEMEKQERQANTTPNIMTHSSAQCQEAHQDKLLFGICGQTTATPEAFSESAPSPMAISPCRHLVYKVCGKNDACAGEEACGAAKQMVSLEEQGQADSGFTSYSQNPTSAQCRQVLAGDAYFKSCGTQ